MGRRSGTEAVGGRADDLETFFFLAGRGRGRRPGACDCGCVTSGVCEPRDCWVRAGAGGGNVPPPPPQLEALSGPFWGAQLPTIPARERAAPAPARSERAGGGFVWFKKCTLLTASSLCPPPPPRAEPRRGPPRVTAAGGGSGKGPGLGGRGARASSPFLWNKGKSVSEASVTPRRAKEAGRVGPATRRKFSARRDPRAGRA